MVWVTVPPLPSLDLDLLGLTGDVLDVVLDLEVAGLADDVAGRDLLAVEEVRHRDVERQVALEVADAAHPLLAVDGGRDLLGTVLDVEAGEAVEVAQAVGRDRVGELDAAVAGEHELLVDALGVHLAGGVGVDLNGLGVLDVDVTLVVRGGDADRTGAGHDPGRGGGADDDTSGPRA